MSNSAQPQPALRGYHLHQSAGDAVAAAGGRPIDFLMASATFRF